MAAYKIEIIPAPQDSFCAYFEHVEEEELEALINALKTSPDDIVKIQSAETIAEILEEEDGLSRIA